VQNDLSAAPRDDKLPPLTSCEKKQSLCWVVTLKDHGGLRKMPVGRRGQDRTEFSRCQSGEKSGPEPVGKVNNPLVSRGFAAAIHMSLLSGRGAPGLELAFLTAGTKLQMKRPNLPDSAVTKVAR
jgi:hypothetical protein